MSVFLYTEANSSSVTDYGAWLCFLNGMFLPLTLFLRFKLTAERYHKRLFKHQGNAIILLLSWADTKRLWWPSHRNLLENRCTPLIMTHMRQQPQNVLECACEGASARFPANQYRESALWLTNQIAAATSVYSPVRCARTHFPCRFPASRFTFWSGVSLILLSLALLYTYCQQLLSIHSLSPTNAYLFSLWGHSIY